MSAIFLGVAAIITIGLLAPKAPDREGRVWTLVGAIVVGALIILGLGLH